MINVKGIKKIASIILIAMIALTANVYATNDSYKTTLSTTKTKVKSGDTIEITIGLKDISIESGEQGIGAYTAEIEFDNSIFEYAEESARGANGWEIMCHESEKGVLIVGNTSNGEVVKTDQIIGTITLKVKDNVKSGETTIKLTNFSGATVGPEVTAPNTSIDIVLYEEQQPEYELGDIDGDGEINATDLLRLRRHLIAGTTNQGWILTDKQFNAGDMNKDGKITATDLLLLVRAIIERLKVQ